MRHFKEIFALAAEHKGSTRALKSALAETAPRPPSEISAVPDDRILAAMTRRVFSAGFSAKVIEAKWEAFELAFEKFDLVRCSEMSEERFYTILEDKGIVRNRAKIRSVHENAQFLLDLAQSHRSAARFFAEWPDSDYVGLLDRLKKKASRLGGETGMRFLRSIGKPAFVLTPDVIRALIREQVIVRPPSGKGDLATIQLAFNVWSEQSGLDLTSISRTLALSVG